MGTRLLVLCFFLFTTAGYCGDASTAENAGALLKDSILSSTLWDAADQSGRPLLCVVERPQGSGPAEGVLRIYRHSKGDFEEIYQLSPSETILGMYPAGGNRPRLITIWGTATGFSVRAFSEEDGVVKQVLYDGSRIAPEVIYVDASSRNESILITDLKWVKANQTGSSRLLPTTTRIYHWNGKEYTVKTVPWQARFSE